MQRYSRNTGHISSTTHLSAANDDDNDVPSTAGDITSVETRSTLATSAGRHSGTSNTLHFTQHDWAAILIKRRWRFADSAYGTSHRANHANS